MSKQSKYPKTLVQAEDPANGLNIVVHNEDEEEVAKKKGFGGRYVAQDYPVMLYKGGKVKSSDEVQKSGKEQDLKTMRVVNNPDEEAEANRDGFKAAGSKPTSVKKS